eukprot:6451286-Prymnesium_polylepis.1
MLNDGFVSGSSSRNAEDTLSKHGCRPAPSKHGLAVRLHRLPRTSATSASSDEADAPLLTAAHKVASHGE